jgi:hypothetical protein
VLLAAQPELVTPLLQVVQRVVERHLLDHQEPKGDEGHGGAVTLIQRFGSTANLSIHLHCLVLDGVYRCGADAKPAFVEADAPIDDEVHAQLQTLIARLMKMLTRGACWSRTWVSPAGRAGCRRRGGARTAAAAGRSHHLPHRLWAVGRAEGVDLARRDAARDRSAPAPVRRHRQVQPACRGTGLEAEPRRPIRLLGERRESAGRCRGVAPPEMPVGALKQACGSTYSPVSGTDVQSAVIEDTNLVAIGCTVASTGESGGAELGGGGATTAPRS